MVEGDPTRSAAAQIVAAAGADVRALRELVAPGLDPNSENRAVDSVLELVVNVVGMGLSGVATAIRLRKAVQTAGLEPDTATNIDELVAEIAHRLSPDPRVLRLATLLTLEPAHRDLLVRVPSVDGEADMKASEEGVMVLKARGLLVNVSSSGEGSLGRTPLGDVVLEAVEALEAVDEPH